MRECEEKGIAYLYYDIETTNGLAEAAVRDIFRNGNIDIPYVIDDKTGSKL
jgi:hypothetical protein